jgi:hypothetical protein
MPGSTLRASLKAFSSPVEPIMSMVSFTAATAASAIDGNLVRREPDAAEFGQLLEFDRSRRRIGLDGFLPFVQTVREDKMAPPFATIDDAIGFILDRRDVLGADVAGRIDLDGGHAGGAKVIFRES